MRNLILLLVIATLAAAPAAAQYNPYVGGKNKVRYDQFEWKTYDTAHFRISYYDKVEPSLEKIASFAESSYDELARRLNFQIFEPVQLITYATHSEFEQTNIIVQFIPEGVGAFATPVRNRMVLPVDLADQDLQQLIQHELTHIFQYEILFQGRKGRAIYRRPPQWFMEGMASYYADDEDSKAEAYMRDAAMSDRLPSIGQNVSGYFAYRFGNKVFQFIEAEWGEDGVRDFVFAFRNTMGGNITRPLEKVFGMDVHEFDGAFRAWLRKRYVDYAGRQTAREFGRRFLTERYASSAEVSPISSPSGDLVAAFTTYKNDIDLAIFGVPDRRLYRNLSKGYTIKYEYMVAQHLTVGGDRGRDIAFSPDGDFVAAFARTDRTRSLLVFDVKKGKLDRSYEVPLPIDQALGPAYSPDGKTIAFKAVNGGQADIYLMDLSDGSVRNLTNDAAHDSAPTYAPEGDRIVYSSQTAEFAKLVEINADGSGGRRQLTFGPGNDEAPILSLGGDSVFFSSDREDGVFDIYEYELESGKLFRLTHVIGAALNPTPVETLEGERVVFQAFSSGGWNLYVADPNLAEEVGVVEDPTPDTMLDLDPYLPAVSITVDPEKAEDLGRRKLFVEDAFLNIGADVDGNILSQTYITFSDQYGDRRLAIILSSVDTFSNFRVSWTNLEPRLQYGATLFDNRSYYLTGYDPVRERFFDRQQVYRQTGLTFNAQYPFSRYLRAQGMVGFLNREAEYLVPNPDYEVPGDDPFWTVDAFEDNIPMVSVGLAGDSVLWRRYGPHQGGRWNTDIFYGYDLEDGGTLSRNVEIDWRRYFAISKRSELAMRVFMGWADGNRPSIYSFGGIDTLRGFRTYSISGNRGGFANFEYRFPLIDRMDLAFMSIGDIRGRVFLDIGAAWYKYGDVEFNYIGEPGFTFIEDGRLVDGVSSYGVGFSMRLFGIPMHWDFVKRWDLKDTLTDSKTYFWIGQKF